MLWLVVSEQVLLMIKKNSRVIFISCVSGKYNFALIKKAKFLVCAFMKYTETYGTVKQQKLIS